MKRRRFQTLISSSIIAAFAAAGMAQTTTPDTRPPVLDPNQAAQLHLAALSVASSTGPVEALAKGTTLILEAVIMEVRGRCQWRVDEKSAWKKAAIDDRLKPGAMIRTGLKSHMAMRCGPNATILVDSNSRVMVPKLAQDGDRLNTIVQVNRGRADFKVDHVGLTNDFSVVTPSGALSVRGTGMGVAYDGFEGTSVHGARFNSINAIEMRYYGSKKVWSVSGPGSTSTRAKNPTNKAVSKTVGGKPLNKAKAMAAKSATKGGGPPAIQGGMQETARTVLAALQGTRERERFVELDEEALELIAEEEAQNAPPPPPPAEPPPPPPPPPPPDDPPPPPPVQQIIDLDGFQAYFNDVVSPSDRGMLAAAIYLDLAPPSSSNPIILNNIEDNGVLLFRHQIPVDFESAVATLMIDNKIDPALAGVRGPGPDGKFFSEGAPLPPGIYDPNSPILSVGDMYAHIIHHGDLRHFNGWLNGDGSPGPLDHDLDVMLQAVDHFANIQTLQFATPEVRAAFSLAVQQRLLPGSIPNEYTNYGQSLLDQHMNGFWTPPPGSPPPLP